DPEHRRAWRGRRACGAGRKPALGPATRCQIITVRRRVEGDLIAAADGHCRPKRSIGPIEDLYGKWLAGDTLSARHRHIGSGSQVEPGRIAIAQREDLETVRGRGN